jgi:hypothetical protein
MTHLVLPDVVKELVQSLFASSRVKAVSNTSTLTLRVVEGDEKGSLESEIVKMVTSPTGLGP